MSSLANNISWFVFGFLATGVAFYPVGYLITNEKINLLQSKSDALLADSYWQTGFYAHIVFGGIALLVGWSQFSSKLRAIRLKLHKTLGKIYVVSVILSGLGALYIAYFATGGLIPSLGFYGLGLVWLATTLGAYLVIKKGNLRQHRILMIYSYAGCFGAVTLRIWLPLLTLAFGEFIIAYKIVAWLAWVPNLIVAYFIIKRNVKPALA